MMEIKKLEYDFSVCKVADYSKANLESDFCFIGDLLAENKIGIFAVATKRHYTGAGKYTGA